MKTTSIVSVLVGSLLLVCCSEKQVFSATIFDFQFNDSAGTNLVAAADSSGNGYVFGGTPYVGLETNGSGSLVFNHVFDVGGGLFGSTRATRSIDLGPGGAINNSLNSVARLTTVFAPWNFSSLNGEINDFRFGFGGTSATNITAQFSLTRPILANPNNQIFLSASAGGGGTSSTPVATFNAIETTPVSIFVDLDRTINTYAVSYQVGSGPEIAFFNGIVARDGGFIRLSQEGTGTNRFTQPNFFAINSMTLTAVPEPASILLLGAFGMGALALRKRGKANPAG